MVRKSELKRNPQGNPIWLPGANQIPSGIYKSWIIHPVIELYSSIPELVNFFDEISILFDQNGNFTLEKLYEQIDEKRPFLQPNYAETYAFALAKDKKFHAAYELFSLIAKDGYKISSIQKDKVSYPLFGHSQYEFGVLGLYYFAKSCFRLGKIEQGKEISNQMILSIEINDNFDYDRQTLDLVINACDAYIKHEQNEELVEFFKNKKENLKKLLLY